MRSGQCHGLCHHCSKDYHHLHPSIHFLHCLAVSIDFGNVLIILRSWTKSHISHPKTASCRPKEPSGNHTGRDRLRNNCLQIIPGSSLQAKFLLKSASQYQSEPLFSRWARLGRRTSAISHSQHKTLHIVLLIQFCYGSCNPETGRNDMRRCGVQAEVGLICGPSLSRVATCNNAVYKKGVPHSLGPRIPGSALLRRRVKPSTDRGGRVQNPPSA